MILEVSDRSHVAAVRRDATALAERRHMTADESGRIALVVTEIATNLLKHGSGGHIALNTFDDASGKGVELIALDKGNGIADIPKALVDGFSTSGTPGNGLGIIQRQANLMTIFSRPEKGTVLVARIAANDPEPSHAAVIGAIAAPYPGETVCGDGWAYTPSPHGNMLLLADGSGHGPHAEHAAGIAINIFRKNASEACSRIIELIHRALAPTRGAAVAIARVDMTAKVVRYVGVGNIVGAAIIGGQVKRMVSHNGTAGMLSPRISEFTYPFDTPPTVILHSDGLTSKWNLDDYPGLSIAHPSVIAGVMFRDFRRGRDDATVLAMR